MTNYDRVEILRDVLIHKATPLFARIRAFMNRCTYHCNQDAEKLELLDKLESLSKDLTKCCTDNVVIPEKEVLHY